MKFGITLGLLNPRVWEEVAREADSLGFESLWLPEHLVFPVAMRGKLRPEEEHPPVPPSTPLYDAAAYLSYLAGITKQIRLGTFVYLLGLRHPFVAARAFATLDQVSLGRAEVGIGAGWLINEWEAAGFDPRTRGRRLDECAALCQRLWTEEVVEHRGEFYSFDPVMFEPKPIQKPHPPFTVGGESDAALRRAVRLGGWIGMPGGFDETRLLLDRLRKLERDADKPAGSTVVTVPARLRGADDIARYRDAGVDRLIPILPGGSRQAVEQARAFAADHF